MAQDKIVLPIDRAQLEIAPDQNLAQFIIFSGNRKFTLKALKNPPTGDPSDPYVPLVIAELFQMNLGTEPQHGN